MKSKAQPSEARFAYEGLDRVIHERARLSVFTSLATHPKCLAFVGLKQLCALTDGNFSQHLDVLEHMAFGDAYLLASAACIGLLTFYLTFVLRSLRYGLAFGSLLTLLYSGIYGLLVSEDNALVLGSLMLFTLLALVMYITRKVDWYKNGSEPTHTKAPIAPPPPIVSQEA